MCEALFVGQNLYAQGVEGGKEGESDFRSEIYVECRIRGKMDMIGVCACEIEKQVLRVIVARTRRRASASRSSPPR